MRITHTHTRTNEPVTYVTVKLGGQFLTTNFDYYHCGSGDAAMKGQSKVDQLMAAQLWQQKRIRGKRVADWGVSKILPRQWGLYLESFTTANLYKDLF